VVRDALALTGLAFLLAGTALYDLRLTLVVCGGVLLALAVLSHLWRPK
jgi:hypothetical protein